jgi:hypothetical protein
VSDLVAKFEDSIIKDCRSRARPSPAALQRTSPSAHSASHASKTPTVSKSPQGDSAHQRSPRSAAVSANASELQLKRASAAAVKSGSAAAVLQLFPANAVWDQDSTTVLREFYGDSTVHGLTVGASTSPKVKSGSTASMSTPLKTTATDHAQAWLQHAL